MKMELQNLYESAYWKTAGGLMRPGGLELTGRMLELSSLCRGAHVLDIGCGRGVSTAFLAEAGFEAVGMDWSSQLLEEARERYPHLVFIRGDAKSIPFSGGVFDAVLLECVLSITSTKEVLAECARVTGTEGHLLISDVYDLDGSGGPLFRAWWESLPEADGFRCIYFEDRTRDLQNFAAQLLWDTGSLEGLRDCIDCEMPAKPGYFALIAKKGK